MGVAGAVEGAIIGRFLATLILRWRKGRSVVHGRSACDGCGLTLGGLELVPLFSALAQRGRCWACGAAIDPLHWRLEAGCVLIGAVALGAMPHPGGVAWALLGWDVLTLHFLVWGPFWVTL